MEGASSISINTPEACCVLKMLWQHLQEPGFITFFILSISAWQGGRSREFCR